MKILIQLITLQEDEKKITNEIKCIIHEKIIIHSNNCFFFTEKIVNITRQDVTPYVIDIVNKFYFLYKYGLNSEINHNNLISSI